MKREDYLEIAETFGFLEALAVKEVCDRYVAEGLDEPELKRIRTPDGHRGLPPTGSRPMADLLIPSHQGPFMWAAHDIPNPSEYMESYRTQKIIYTNANIPITSP